MATQRTPINEPTNSRSRTKVRGTRTATRRSHQQRTSSRHPSPGRLVSVSRAAVLALAIWLVAAGATNDYQPTRGARSDQTIPAAQHELTDHEIQRFNNRVEADRRQVESWQLEQQEIEQSEEREVQRFNNRAEADRRQVGKQRGE